MRYFKAFTLLALAIAIGTLPAQATIFSVLAGSDYFTTQAGTTFGGVPFNGVPSGPGSTDTIIERLNDVALGTGPGGSGSTSLLMTQLQLESAVPANFGLGVGFYFITLQSARGGPNSTGSMTINLTSIDDHAPLTAEGTFSSSIDVFFDVRFGATNGPIAQSGDLVLTSSGSNWDGNPAPTDLLVPGLTGNVTANFHTNKTQTADIDQMDLFPISTVTESHPTGATHVVSNTSTNTPEPGTMAIAGGALLLLLYHRKSAGGRKSSV